MRQTFLENGGRQTYVRQSFFIGIGIADIIFLHSLNILGAGISILLKSIGIENANSISSGIAGGIVGALYPLWNKIKK